MWLAAWLKVTLATSGSTESDLWDAKQQSLEADGRGISPLCTKIRTPENISPLKVRHCNHYQVSQTRSKGACSSVIFSYMKESLLQLSIIVLFIQPEKFRTKANGYLIDLAHRKAISPLLPAGIPDIQPPATAAGDLTAIHSQAVIEFWGSIITLGN